jgi:hypothetical protein
MRNVARDDARNGHPDSVSDGLTYAAGEAPTRAARSSAAGAASPATASSCPAPWDESGPTARRLRRLWAMPWTEVAHRGWEGASTWFERVSPPSPDVAPDVWLRSRAPELAYPEAALRLVRDQLPRRFFAGATDAKTVAVLRTRLPGASEAIVAAADELLEGRFDLLGYRGLQFGDPIDWHLEPVTGRRSPLTHWSRLNALAPDVVGDSKVVWELNRHQWLVRLAQAWLVTGDPRYAAACVHAIDAWRRANPPGMGINWASSLELAFRLMSWCWTALLIRNAPSMTGPWAMQLLVSIGQHAHHISRHLSYYYSPNTHLTGEALGLVYAGTLFPEFHDAEKWRRVGTRVLLAESRVQLFGDGVHFEQSTCYHRYTVEMYLHLVLLARRNGVALPGELLEGVQRMIEYLVAVRRPDGSIPPIGDSDGGVLLPLTPRQAHDSRGVFALAASACERPDFAWAAEGAAPEVLWFMGPSGLEKFDTIRKAPPPDEAASRLFPEGGYGVMRSGWTADAHHLIVDVGPLGCPTSSGHGHADLLSVQGAIFGEPCLVDAGTYCYTLERPWREFFRSTAAHSALSVDGQDQAESAGPFRWHQRPRVRLRSWQSAPDRDVLDAEHDAYARLADPVTCRRRVVFVKPDYWVLVDDVAGAATHAISVAFQFAPTMRVTLVPDGWARAETPRGRVLWVWCLAAGPVQASLTSGSRDPIRGWTSADYGQRHPAPMLVYSATLPLPSRLVTVLLPQATGSASPPLVTPTYDAAGCPTGVRLAAPGRAVRVEGDNIVIAR